MNSLKSKIQNHQSIIGVIGLGYVGLPLAIRFSKVGFSTIGFDIDDEKIKLLNAGKSYIKHIDVADITAIANNGFTATSDFSKIADVDVIIICVPTPLGTHNEPDLSYIYNTLDSIKPYLKENQLLILESTTYPGTTDEILVPFIESIENLPAVGKAKAGSESPEASAQGGSSRVTRHVSRFSIGENFFIGYSPERVDPGNQKFTIKTIPKVISATTENCLELTVNLYDQIVDKTVRVSSPKVAEMTKILENIHRAVNIGLVNELKMVADKMDINIHEVINAAATKPFGFTPYFPGPGLGGHCIPIDPFYLTWKANEIGIKTRFIELAGEINTAMPNYVVQKVDEALSTVSKFIKNSKILVLGLAYKKNIDDIREAPSLSIIDILMKKGAHVQYSDPYLPIVPKTRKYNFDMESINLTVENIYSFDVIILSTDHDNFDYNLLKERSKLIVDTRGVFEPANNIFRA